MICERGIGGGGRFGAGVGVDIAEDDTLDTLCANDVSSGESSLPRRSDVLLGGSARGASVVVPVGEVGERCDENELLHSEADAAAA